MPSRRNAVRSFLIIMGIGLTLGSRPIEVVNAQEMILDSRFMELRAIHRNFANGESQEKQIELERDLERLRVPAYNADLSKEIVSFHRHIADMHFRHVSCKSCRDHVKRLNELTKRIDRAMK